MTALRDLTPLRDVVAQTGPGASGTQFVAVALQALRRASRLTPTEFAERANLSLADVGLAELGTVPWHVLTGYLTAADADGDDRRFVRELWERMQQHDAPRGIQAVRPASSGAAWHVAAVGDLTSACAPTADASARRPITPPCPDLSLWPDPARIGDALEFRAALVKIKNSTGTSYARLAKVADGLGYPLPRTTLHNLCTRQRLPVNAQIVSTFVTACGADEPTARAWVTTWQRLRTTTRDAGTELVTTVASAQEHALVPASGDDQVRGTDDEGRHPLDPDLGDRGDRGVSTLLPTAIASSAVESASMLWSAFGTPLIGLLLFFLGLFSGLFLG